MNDKTLPPEMLPRIPGADVIVEGDIVQPRYGMSCKVRDVHESYLLLELERPGCTYLFFCPTVAFAKAGRLN